MYKRQVVARLLLVRASLLARQGLDEAAQQAYRLGLQEAEHCEDAYIISGYLGLLELAESRGDLDEAHQWLQKAERAMQWSVSYTHLDVYKRQASDHAAPRVHRG